MSEQNVVGRYDDTSQAEEAIRSLDQGDFPIKEEPSGKAKES